MFQKRRNARDVIFRNVRAFMIRRKWEKQIELMYGGYLKIVIRIQKVFRWRRRWGMILDYVDSRKKCAIRLQKAWRRRKLHLFFMSVINARMEKRIILQRAFRFFAMHQFVLAEINRRINSKKAIKVAAKIEFMQQMEVTQREFEGCYVKTELELIENLAQGQITDEQTAMLAVELHKVRQEAVSV